jgi:hypothetical protein
MCHPASYWPIRRCSDGSYSSIFSIRTLSSEIVPNMWDAPLLGISVTSATTFWSLCILLVASLRVIALVTLLSLINQVSGTPYIVGGDSPAGTDCSGLVSWVANAASDRPVFGNRFETANEEAALFQRGFHYGTAPDALVVGWNGRHTAASLPDGTPVSSGEHGGVHFGGGGAYQPQFTHHMFLPMAPEQPAGDPPPTDAPPAIVDTVNPGLPAPAPDPAPAVDPGIENI